MVLFKKRSLTVNSEDETRYDEKHLTLELDLNKVCQLLIFVGLLLFKSFCSLF